MISLHALCDFDRSKEIYEKNKEKDWNDWLAMKELFPRRGKQGIAGVLRTKDEERYYVFKISQYVNYLVHHELTIMEDINELAKFCPNFCRGFGAVLVDVDARNRENPLESKSKYLVEKEMMLMEYIDDARKLYSYLKSDRVSDDLIHSTILQVLLSVKMAQNHCSFTHYDLHSNNILMKKCSRNLVALYVIDENNQYCVPTFGRYPVIIDYGFAFSNNLNGGPLWPSMGHTHAGFMSDRHDPVADPKLFMLTIADELNHFRPGKKSELFNNITENIFYNIKVDTETGWDEYFSASASDYVVKLFEKYETSSLLFSKYIHFALDIVQTLIILPLECQKYKDIGLEYQVFVHEFTKIENDLGSPFYSLYILKCIVDSARNLRLEFVNKETRQQAITKFRREIYQRVDSISRYTKLKGVHYGKMLCSLYCLARSIEGVFYRVVSHQMARKERDYSRMRTTSIEEIVGILMTNIPDKYTYSDETTLLVIDHSQRECYTREITKLEARKIMKIEHLFRGKYIYDEIIAKKVLKKTINGIKTYSGSNGKILS